MTEHKDFCLHGSEVREDAGGSTPRRWNWRKDSDGVLWFCRGYHDKTLGCEWECDNGVDGGRLESPEAALPSTPKRAVVAIETLEQVIAEIRALSIIELGNADLIDRDDVLAKLAALIRQETEP